jgi:hypothetical protein
LALRRPGADARARIAESSARTQLKNAAQAAQILRRAKTAAGFWRMATGRGIICAAQLVEPKWWAV